MSARHKQLQEGKGLQQAHKKKAQHPTSLLNFIGI
jgi:hypothetical protein